MKKKTSKRLAQVQYCIALKAAREKYKAAEALADAAWIEYCLIANPNNKEQR